MAAKIEWVVVDGCVQDGGKIFKSGDVYVPPSKAVQEALEAEGKIVARGKLPSAGARIRPQPTPGPGGVPAPTPDEVDDDDDDDDSGD